MASIDDARRQISESRKIYSQRIQDLNSQEEQLNSIPLIPIKQNRIRPNLSKKDITNIENENRKRKEQIEAAKEKINQQRQSLENFKSQIDQEESSLNDYQAEQEAYKNAQILFKRKIDPRQLAGSREYKYYQDLINASNEQEELYSQLNQGQVPEEFNKRIENLKQKGLSEQRAFEEVLGLNQKDYDTYKQIEEQNSKGTYTITTEGPQYVDGVIVRDYENGSSIYIDPKTNEPYNEGKFGKLNNASLEPKSIGLQRDFTEQERRENQFSTSLYSEYPITAYVKERLGDVQQFLGEAYKGASDYLNKNKKGVFSQEYKESKEGAQSGTLILTLSSDSELSDQALLERQTLKEDLPKEIILQEKIKQEKENIQSYYQEELKKNIETGNISSQEDLDNLSDIASKSASLQFLEKAEQLRADFLYETEKRAKERAIEIYSKKGAIKTYISKLDVKLSEFIGLPEIQDYTNNRFARQAYENIYSSLPDNKFTNEVFFTSIKAADAAISFEAGLYKGIKEKPITAISNAAISAGLVVATSGTGALIAKGAGGAIIPKSITSAASAALKYGIPTIYSTSVFARTYTGEIDSSLYNLGFITSTEILPLYGGYKFGRFLTEPQILKQPSEYSNRKVKTVQPKLEIIKKDTIERLGDYSIGKNEVLAYRPSAYQMQTNRIGEFLNKVFGKDPFLKKVYVSNPAIYRVYQVEGKENLIVSKNIDGASKIVNSPIIGVERIGKTGVGNSRTYYILQGEQREIIKDALQGEIKNYQRDFLRNIVYNENSRLYLESVGAKKLGKINFSNKEFTIYLPKEGKTISRFESFVIADKIAKTEGYDYYKIFSKIREIDELPRSGARIEDIRGISKVANQDLREKMASFKEFDVNDASPPSVQKPQSINDLIKKITSFKNAPQDKLKEIGNAAPRKTNLDEISAIKEILKKSKINQADFPQIVSGEATKTPSSYQADINYEKSVETAFIIPKAQARASLTPSMSSADLANILFITKAIDLSMNIPKIKDINIESSINITGQAQKPAQINKPSQVNIESQISRQIQSQIASSLSFESSVQMPKIDMNSPITTSPSNVPSTPPIYPPKLFFKTKGNGKGNKKRSYEEELIYNPDFTSKALGLVDIADDAELRKIINSSTGLETRKILNTSY